MHWRLSEQLQQWTVDILTDLLRTCTRKQLLGQQSKRRHLSHSFVHPIKPLSTQARLLELGASFFELGDQLLPLMPCLETWLHVRESRRQQKFYLFG